MLNVTLIARCRYLGRDRPGTPCKSQTFNVKVGSHLRNRGQLYRVQLTVPHPSYHDQVDDVELSNDIGLIKLRTDITIRQRE